MNENNYDVSNNSILENEVFFGEKKLISKIIDAKEKTDFKLVFNLIGRLLNKYEKVLKKLLKKRENKALMFDERKLIEDKINYTNNLILNYKMELKKLYKEGLNNLKGKKNLAKNGELRKIYIDYIEKELKKLSSKIELTGDEKNYLQTLDKEFQQLIDQYKKNLNNQYKEELIDSDANLMATFVALPKGCLISIKKINACIKDVHNAKNNKDKAVKIMNIVQATAELAATPMLYLGKFAINSILLITLGTSLNLSDKKKKVFIDNVIKKISELVEDIAQNKLGKITPEVATVGKIR